MEEGHTIQWKKENNDIQNITQKAKDQATWNPLKTGSEHSLRKADKLWIGNRHRMWEIYLIKGCFSTQNHIYLMSSISCLLQWPWIWSTCKHFPVFSSFMTYRRVCIKVNNDIQNITQKTKHQATSNPLKLGANSGAPEGIAVPVLHDTRCETTLTHHCILSKILI
jgi:hypothetical protein